MIRKKDQMEVVSGERGKGGSQVCECSGPTYLPPSWTCTLHQGPMPRSMQVSTGGC